VGKERRTSGRVTLGIKYKRGRSSKNNEKSFGEEKRSWKRSGGNGGWRGGEVRGGEKECKVYKRDQKVEGGGGRGSKRIGGKEWDDGSGKGEEDEWKGYTWNRV
jgi:hypothetical protein